MSKRDELAKKVVEQGYSPELWQQIETQLLPCLPDVGAIELLCSAMEIHLTPVLESCVEKYASSGLNPHTLILFQRLAMRVPELRDRICDFLTEAQSDPGFFRFFLAIRPYMKGNKIIELGRNWLQENPGNSNAHLVQQSISMDFEEV